MLRFLGKLATFPVKWAKKRKKIHWPNIDISKILKFFTELIWTTEENDEERERNFEEKAKVDSRIVTVNCQFDKSETRGTNPFGTSKILEKNFWKMKIFLEPSKKSVDC